LVPYKTVKSFINKYYKIEQNECHYVYNIVILLLSWVIRLLYLKVSYICVSLQKYYDIVEKIVLYLIIFFISIVIRLAYSMVSYISVWFSNPEQNKTGGLPLFSRRLLSSANRNVEVGWRARHELPLFEFSALFSILPSKIPISRHRVP